jgi:hypothetical protein
LTVNYTVTDSQGNVLASGPLTPHSLLPGLNLYSVGTTIPASVPPGNTETITLSAADVDTVDFPITATAQLFISPNHYITTLGLGITSSNGDTFSGSGQGRVHVVQPPGGGIIVSGVGSLQIASNPENSSQLNASASGNFFFSEDARGNIALNLNQARATLNTGMFAGDTTASTGFSITAAGNLDFTRNANAGITAHARGSIQFAAETAGLGTTVLNTPVSIRGTGQNVAIGLATDGAGNFQLNFSGKFRLFGSLHNTSNSGTTLVG